VRLSIIGLAVGTAVLSAGCTRSGGDRAERQAAAIESVRTDLGGSCRSEIDKSDPNETPYLVCPGVRGYSLIVRRVDSGRQSIDVVDSAQQTFPLSYHEVVTRFMSDLDSTAEWRVANRDGKQIPVALIVRVHAHEDLDTPEKVTRTYFAVAKITPNEACVTDRIPEGAQSENELRSAADSAPQRPCAPAQPPMTADGTIVR
jgi:hypothetical protein